LRTVRDAPGAGTKEGALLGIIHRESDLIALLDADAILAAHRTLTAAIAEPVEETV
jgi:hypothetical protein